MNKIGIILLCLTAFTNVVLAAPLTPIEELGKKLFFDTGLSNPPGQSCASCHDPAVGWTGPNSLVNAAGAVEEGAVLNRFGNRKPPMSAYAGYNPILAWHEGGGMGGGGMGMGGGMGDGMGAMTPAFVGGLFWDGRATGWTLGDPLAEQAMGPFLNPLEMNNPNEFLVCEKVKSSDYAYLFLDVWGKNSLNCARKSKEVYERIARSIAAYERSGEKNPFNSKFDQFWDAAKAVRPPVPMINMMNQFRFKNLGLNDMELMGLVVFNTKGKCSTCHLLQPMHGSPYPLFTDFRYHNLGIPKNPLNPFYDMPRIWNPDGSSWIDPGLGGFLATTDYAAKTEENYGKHRTPSLRNVDKRPDPAFVKAYGHNGYFKSLMHIIHFYNVRDVDADCSISTAMGMPCIEPPEVAENVNTVDLGDLKLTPQEGMALVQFLKTLSDQ
jgi:cytochrome c peroxidase